MADSGLGVVLDSFGQPVKDALRIASDLAFRQVELPVARGEVDPANLSRTGRRHLLHYVSDLGLQLSALSGDLGGGRFSDSSSVEQRVDKTRLIIELAAELRVPIVTTHLGRVDEKTLKQGYLAEAVRSLAEVCDRTGTFLAFETASADPRVLGGLLSGMNCQSLGACYDPASLLIDGHDPLEGMEPLANRILIARARDAVAGSGQRPGHETAFGDGQVDFAAYLAMLDQAGYRSTPFIRRTQSEHPQQEIAAARDHLTSIMHSRR